MKIEKTSIYIDIKELHKLLYRAQFTMTKGDRIIMGNRLLDLNQQLISLHSRATAAEKDPWRRFDYIEEMIGVFDALRLNLQVAADMTMFKEAKATVDRENQPKQKIFPLVVSIFERIAMIETGINKWRSATKTRIDSGDKKNQSA